MGFSVVTSAKFNQNPSEVKRAAREQPVIVTERGRRSLVVMSYEAYEALAQAPRLSLFDALADERAEADKPFEPGRAAFEDREIAF